MQAQQTSTLAQIPQKPDVAARRKCSSTFWNPWFLAKVIILLIAIDLFTYFWVGVGLVRADQKLRFLTSIIGTGTWLGCYRFSPDLITNDCGRKPNVLDCILQLQVSLKTLTLHGRGTSAEPLLFSTLTFFARSALAPPGAVHLKGALPPSGLTPPGGLAGYLKN